MLPGSGAPYHRVSPQAPWTPKAARKWPFGAAKYAEHIEKMEV